MTDLGTWITAGLAFVAAIVWLVRIEGRSNVHHAIVQALKERVDGIENRIMDSLNRIENKLDSKVDKP